MVDLALEIRNLSKRYGSTVALRDLSFSIPRGQFFGLLGPNGAGKSTTINLISGIARMESGIIRVFGKDVVADYREARRQVGLSPQEFNVDIFEKVVNILDFSAGYFGLRAATRRDRIDALLARFDLAAHAHKEFRALSGGLKRRVLLARALVHDPELLILDEPTAGVDVELRRDLWRYLRELNASGKTIVLTSHYLEEVEMLCERIAVIYGGAVVEEGAMTDLLAGGKKLEERYLELTTQAHAV